MSIKSFTRAFFCFSALALIVACGSIKPEDYRERHQLVVGEEAVSIDIDASRKHVCKDDETRVKTYIADYLKRGEGKVELTAYYPKNRKGSVRKKAFSMAGDLMEYGLRREEIVVRMMPAKTKEQQKIFNLAFKAYRVQVPQCGKWDNWKEAYMWHNQPDANFGCATQRNIGLMVANPRDLIKMRAKQGRSSARAMDVLNKYSVGAETASQSDVSAALTSGN